MQTGRCGVPFLCPQRVPSLPVPICPIRAWPSMKTALGAAQPGRLLTRASDNPCVLLHCGILPLLNVEQSTSAAVRTRLRPVSK